MRILNAYFYTNFLQQKKFPNLWPGQLQYYSAMSYSQQCNELVHTKQHTSRIVRIV